MEDINNSDMVDVAQQYQNVDDVKKSLDDIKDSMSLVDADLKGIKVDESI